LIYLDTHIVVWLYAGLIDKFRLSARTLLNRHDLAISPVVRLELQYLYEIGRVAEQSSTIIDDLAMRLGLQLNDSPFDLVVRQALTDSWTRDPFDRLIVATAALDGSMLMTKDERILAHYAQAVW
jgi:PIN domain nuclease of toxin-antitoxin system